MRVCCFHVQMTSRKNSKNSLKRRKSEFYTFNWVFAHSSDKRESWRGKFYQHHSRRRHVVTSPSLCLKLCLLTRVIKIASGAAARVKWVKSLVWKWNSISQFLVGFTFRRCGERFSRQTQYCQDIFYTHEKSYNEVEKREKKMLPDTRINNSS